MFARQPGQNQGKTLAKPEQNLGKTKTKSGQNMGKRLAKPEHGEETLLECAGKENRSKRDEHIGGC